MPSSEIGLPPWPELTFTGAAPLDGAEVAGAPGFTGTSGDTGAGAAGFPPLTGTTGGTRIVEPAAPVVVVDAGAAGAADAVGLGLETGAAGGGAARTFVMYAIFVRRAIVAIM